MTKILSIEAIIIEVPTMREHVLAMTTLRHHTLCLVKVTCEDAIEGWGEASTINGLAYGPESPEGIKLAIDNYIAPLILGCDATRPLRIMREISRQVVGNNFARCAIETALLDAQGKRVGLPVSELLGGRVRDSLPVAWTLASGETGRDIAEAEQMLDRRQHNIFKLKIGKRSVHEDVAHVEAIKRALGDRASVRVDVNMAWSAIEARRAIALLADVGCDLVEQPIDRANRTGMARLVSTAPIPIMADEALNGPETAYDYIRDGAADVLAIKIAQSGGLDRAKRVEAIADAAGVAVYGGTMLEAAFGTAASAQVCATFHKLDFGTELFGPLLMLESLLSEPLAYKDFALVVPEGPGLGVAPDEDCIAALRRDAARPTISIPKVAS